MKLLRGIFIAFLIILVLVLAVVNLRLAAKLEKKADIASSGPSQTAAVPKAAPTKAGKPTPLANTSLEGGDRSGQF